MVKKKETPAEAKQKKDYLWHLIFFVMGIVVGLLYYKIFLIDYYYFL